MRTLEQVKEKYNCADSDCSYCKGIYELQINPPKLSIKELTDKYLKPAIKQMFDEYDRNSAQEKLDDKDNRTT